MGGASLAAVPFPSSSWLRPRARCIQLAAGFVTPGQGPVAAGTTLLLPPPPPPSPGASRGRKCGGRQVAAVTKPPPPTSRIGRLPLKMNIMDFNVKKLAADAGTFLSRAVQVRRQSSAEEAKPCFPFLAKRAPSRPSQRRASGVGQGRCCTRETPPLPSPPSPSPPQLA